MRAAVFIDGSNFYFKLKHLGSGLPGRHRLLDFDFGTFAAWLAAPHDLFDTRYYIGAVKQDEQNEKSKRLFTDQQRLLRLLQRQHIAVTLGHVIRHPDKTFHEKGVDVRIAVEMIRLAREDRYDVAYLVSSDTDLVPAVEEVQSLGKRVCYVGIPKGQSYGLSKNLTMCVFCIRRTSRHFLTNVRHRFGMHAAYGTINILLRVITEIYHTNDSALWKCVTSCRTHSSSKVRPVLR